MPDFQVVHLPSEPLFLKEWQESGTSFTYIEWLDTKFLEVRECLYSWLTEASKRLEKSMKKNSISDGIRQGIYRAQVEMLQELVIIFKNSNLEGDKH